MKQIYIYKDVFKQIIYMLIRDFSVPICIWSLFFTKWWPLVLLYLMWMYRDRNSCENGGKPYYRLVNTNYTSTNIDYFPIRVHGVENCKLKPEKNYMLVNLPHGLYVWGITSLIQSPKHMRTLFTHHKFYLAFLTLLFHLPIARELIYTRNLISSSAKAIDFMLKDPDGGNVVVITPDGLRGILLTEKGQHSCYLKKRKGFVKLALKNGTPIIPSYIFGEVDLYDQFLRTPSFRKFQDWFKRVTTVTLTFPKGYFNIFPLNLIPHRVPLNLVLGEPIEVEINENPSSDDINSLHEIFVRKLTELFHQYKSQFIKNSENVDLNIL